MQDDLISIIVPVRKEEEYLDRCVDSLVNQSYENIEIILVDNGEDTNSQICESWKEKDKRIKVIKNPKGNLASAKNAGLDNAKGEYITFVNSNNFVDKEYAFTLLKNLKETNSDISICHLCKYLENNKPTSEEDQDEAKDEDLEEETSDENTSENETEKPSKTENLAEEKEDEVEVSLKDDDTSDENDDTDDDASDDAYDEDDADDDSDTEDDEDESDEDSDDEEGGDYEADFYTGYNNYDVDEDEDKPFDLKNMMVKLLEKYRARSRIVLFEGDDIFDYIFAGTDVIKTATFAKLYKKEIFKNLRFDEDRLYEDEFIVHKIYLNCKKFVKTSSQLYYYRVDKKPLKTAPKFVLKDLDRYYALEQRYNYFKDTQWKQKVLSQLLIQMENIYCFARAGKADTNILNFLKHKFKLYYRESKKHKLHHKCFKKFPTLFYIIKRMTLKKM